MRASIGDTVVLHTRYAGTGERERAAVILAVRGEDGAPPYVVRWDDGHETTITPGSDALVEHYPAMLAGG